MNKYDFDSNLHIKVISDCGVEVILDIEDYCILKRYKWSISTGTKSTTPYASVSEYSKDNNTLNTSMHRIVMNAPKGIIVDHINHNTLDNRKCNLRFATDHQNAFNKRAPIDVGVNSIKSSNEWNASITCHGVYYNLGSFKNREDAIKARRQGEKDHYGEFAYDRSNDKSDRFRKSIKPLIKPSKDFIKLCQNKGVIL